VGKLKSLVSSKDRIKAVDTKLNISLNKQLKLLSVSKTAHYYYKLIQKFSSEEDLKLLNIIDKIHKNIHIFLMNLKMIIIKLLLIVLIKYGVQI